MKLYKHTYNANFFKNEPQFEIIPLEVEEKTKVYIVKSSDTFCYGKTRISKDEINKLQYGFYYFMYSFSNDTTEFIRALVAKKEQSIKALNEKLENEIKTKNNLLEMLGGVNNG